MIPQPKPCQLCHQPFYPAKTNSRYCAACAGKANYYRKKVKRAINKLTNL